MQTIFASIQTIAELSSLVNTLEKTKHFVYLRGHFQWRQLLPHMLHAVPLPFLALADSGTFKFVTLPFNGRKIA